jgi:hypothetical protein
MLTLSTTQIEKIEAFRHREIIEDMTDWMIKDYELEAMPTSLGKPENGNSIQPTTRWRLKWRDSLHSYRQALSHETEEIASEMSENRTPDGVTTERSPMSFSTGTISSALTRER